MKLVKAECEARSIRHFGLVENVVCDPADQAIFRAETGWPQFLVCSGTLSRVRRPRFFWISEPVDFSAIGLVEPGPNYTTVHISAPLEPNKSLGFCGVVLAGGARDFPANFHQVYP